MNVSVKQASAFTCGLCGHSIGPRNKDPGHSKKDLIRCLYKANIGVIQIMQENKWLHAEKKWGDLPKEDAKESIKKDEGGYLFIYEDGLTIETNKEGDIVDVVRPDKNFVKTGTVIKETVD